MRSSRLIEKCRQSKYVLYQTRVVGQRQEDDDANAL